MSMAIAVAFVAGFVAGYALRSLVSARRRTRARRRVRRTPVPGLSLDFTVGQNSEEPDDKTER
jgi:hypothetical protein